MSKIHVVNFIIFLAGLLMVVFMLASSPNNAYSQIDALIFLLIGVVLMMSAWLGFLISRKHN